MKSKTKCAECDQLRKTYSEATVRYMRFYNGERLDTEETRKQSGRLYNEMSDAKRALIAHEQEHIVG